jgi:hypothetical protein
MHPGRWAPVGPKAKFFVKGIDCEACRNSGDCRCIREVPAHELSDYLERLSGNKR